MPPSPFPLPLLPPLTSSLSTNLTAKPNLTRSVPSSEAIPYGEAYLTAKPYLNLLLTMRDTLKLLRDKLRPIYGNRETEAIFRLIFLHVKGWKTVDMIIHEPDPLSPFAKSEIEGILDRLLQHEPIQYITGLARFHGLDFKVDKNVLIPRPETEELVDMIVDQAGEKTDLRVLDIGTGSGCIAISLARALRFPKVTAIDVSPGALSIAQENAKTLSADVKFINADIFQWSPDSPFDIIVSNPPYIDESESREMEDNVLLHEPHSALFVPDSDPLVFYRRILSLAKDWLAPGGKVYFEINPRHASELVQLAKQAGMEDVNIVRDSFGKERFLTATNPDV